MGYGGNLIWTTVFKALHERDGRALAPVNLPLLSDLLCGALHDRSVSYRNDPIFRGNPRLTFPAVIRKSGPARIADRVFGHLLRLAPVRRAFEDWVFRRTERGLRDGAPRPVHIDMRRHSYAAAQTRLRTIWKQAPRAVDAMLEAWGGGQASIDCEMYFDATDHETVDTIRRDAGLAGRFVAVEPETNTTYFGDLRAWPSDRWAALVDALRAARPEIEIVQLGTGAGPALPGVKDLRGRTSFRTAALLLAQAQLFVGTEGGLMHAANAVRARSLILWGGLTLPEFIGYPARQRTICKYVPCAPCGQHGWCNVGHRCMRDIGVSEVAAAAVDLLGEPSCVSG